MNLEEFQKKYKFDADGKFIAQHTTIEIACDVCGKICRSTRENAEKKIKKYGMYLCRACAMERMHEENPRSEETREKQRQGRLGKKASEETKKKMSDSANEKWQTDWGKNQKKVLAKKAILENASKKPTKSKRKVLYISAKNGGDIRVCNSSYEFVACEDFLEKDESITHYESQVPYEINGRIRSLDFLVYYVDGMIRVIEVKPKKRLNEDFHKQQMADSGENAKRNGWSFWIWMEDELKIKPSKEATKRADEYRKAHYLIDYQAYRMQKNRDKAKKFYDKNIKDNRVMVYCDFCKTYHSVLRISYDQNVKKNGRFICIVENGHIIGKRSKVKANPYADMGKKQCNRCDRILPLTDKCFNKDKSTPDGWSRKCIECNQRDCRERYENKKKNKPNDKGDSI